LKQTEKVFKLLETPSALKKVFIATDHNFKATALNEQKTVSFFIFT